MRFEGCGRRVSAAGGSFAHSAVILCVGRSRSAYFIAIKPRPSRSLSGRADARNNIQRSRIMHTNIGQLGCASNSIREEDPDVQALRWAENKVEDALGQETESKKRLWRAEGVVLKRSQVIHEQSKRIREAKEGGAASDQLEMARAKLRLEKAERENLRSRVAFDRDCVVQCHEEVRQRQEDVELQALKLQKRELQRELELHEDAVQRCRVRLSTVNKKFHKAMRWERAFMRGDDTAVQETERTVMPWVDDGEEDEEDRD